MSIIVVQRGESQTYQFKVNGVSDLVDLSIYIGNFKFSLQNADLTDLGNSLYELKLSGEQTNLMKGQLSVSCAIESPTIGIRKIDRILVADYQTSNASKTTSATTSLIDALIVLDATTETVSVDSVLFTTLKGVDGKSAYEIAVENGFQGTEAQFASQFLIGTPLQDDSVALTDIDGTHEWVKADFLKKLSWNPEEDTLDIGQNGSTLQVGQELQYFVRNQSGVTIPDGTPVMAVGTVGNSGKILIAKMNFSTIANSMYFLGLTTEEIPNNGEGKVTKFGKVRNINTTAFNDGDVLYLSNANPSVLTKTKPTYALPVAFVVHSHASGTLMVRADNYSGDVAYESDGDIKLFKGTASEVKIKTSLDAKLDKETYKAWKEVNQVDEALRYGLVAFQRGDNRMIPIDVTATNTQLVFRNIATITNSVAMTVILPKITHPSQIGQKVVLFFTNSVATNNVKINGNGAAINSQSNPAFANFTTSTKPYTMVTCYVASLTKWVISGVDTLTSS